MLLLRTRYGSLYGGDLLVLAALAWATAFGDFRPVLWLLVTVGALLRSAMHIAALHKARLIHDVYDVRRRWLTENESLWREWIRGPGWQDYFGTLTLVLGVPLFLASTFLLAWHQGWAIAFTHALPAVMAGPAAFQILTTRRHMQAPARGTISRAVSKSDPA